MRASADKEFFPDQGGCGVDGFTDVIAGDDFGFVAVFDDNGQTVASGEKNVAIGSDGRCGGVTGADWVSMAVVIKTWSPKTTGDDDPLPGMAEFPRRTISVPAFDNPSAPPFPSVMLTGVIDYGAGNLRSVCNALGMLHAEHRLVKAPADLDGIDALIFPGVGSYGDSMENLIAQNLADPIRDWVRANRPFLGICIGYQLLFEGSEESPDIPGLGVFKGQVVRFSEESKLKIPHMGWNNIKIEDPSDPLWKVLPANPFVYFVHSFFPRPEDESLISSTAKHGEKFAASIRSGNVTATQFHPEKSQSVGLQLIRNFLDSATVTAAN